MVSTELEECKALSVAQEVLNERSSLNKAGVFGLVRALFHRIANVSTTGFAAAASPNQRPKEAHPNGGVNPKRS
jgi:hypothetical protein